MRSLTVGHLRQLTQHLPPNTVVLVPASDHSYRKTKAFIGTAIYDERNGWCEDFDEDNQELEEGCVRVQVLIIQ